MFKKTLKLHYLLDKKRTRKKIEKNSAQASDSSIIWSIISFFLKWTTLIFFGAIILFPFFFMISTSLMSNDEVRDTLTVHIIPKNGLHWENFKIAFQDGYWSAILLTLLVTSLSIVFKLFLTILLGYAFAYNKWRFKKAIWWSLLILLMIPEMGLLVGQYKTTVDLKLNVNNKVVIAMFLPFIASVFSGFMFRNAFEAIPTRTKEAALIDGATELKYFWKIALPMISPTIWTVTILTAFAAWNSYMWPSLLVSGQVEKKNVLSTWLFTTGLDLDDNGVSRGVLANIRLAASILVALPLVIVYFGFRKKIMKAISKQGNAIKG